MNAVLSAEERATIRRISRRSHCIVAGRVRWEALILAELQQGPSSRLELIAIIRPRYTKDDLVALHGGVRRLIAKGDDSRAADV
jgi:hypothetical protein